MRFLVAPHSVKALSDISQNQRLAPKIDTLRLGIEYLDEVDSDDFFEEERDDARVGEVELINEQERRCAQYLDTQKAFSLGDDVVMLSLILSRLTNLKHIEIGYWNLYYWDGNTPFPYGMEMAARETRVEYVCNAATTFFTEDMGSYGSAPDDDGLNQNLRVVLRALSLSRRPIETLSACDWRGSCYPIGCLRERAIPQRSMYFKEGLLSSLGNLRSLSLSVSFRKDDLGFVTPGPTWLPWLINLMPGLQNLKLLCDDWDGDFEDRLMGFSDFVNHSYMPNLTSFELMNAVVLSQDLEENFQQYDGTLSRIAFTCVNLLCSSWHQLAQTHLRNALSSDGKVELNWLIEGAAPYIIDGSSVIFNESAYGIEDRKELKKGFSTFYKSIATCQAFTKQQLSMLKPMKKVPLEVIFL